MAAPKVFISYSHDSPAHRGWVQRLATDLTSNGVQTILDEWDLLPGQDTVAFMTKGIAESDRVLMLCTPNYIQKATSGAGGVGFEGLIITGELVQNIDTRKFVPLVRDNSGSQLMPAYLGSRKYIDFRSDTAYGAKLDELLRDIHGQPRNARPPLGPNPFSGTPTPTGSSSRIAGSSGLTATGEPVLADVWFSRHSEQAAAGLQKIGLTGCMELRFALHEPLSKSQLELLNAVRSSEIHTFGWPIAVTLDNREEFRPRPTADGVAAEISSAGGLLLRDESYDYWAARNNGDFYVLQSLFEDQRAKNALFADTRIVRVTESLMFAANLYRNLGATDDTKVSIRVAHRGLAGRVLTAASPRRHVWETKTQEDVSESQVVSALGQLMPRVVDLVMQIVEPLFMLFDFKKLDRKVYEEIVVSFVNGKVV